VPRVSKHAELISNKDTLFYACRNEDGYHAKSQQGKENMTHDVLASRALTPSAF